MKTTLKLCFLVFTVYANAQDPMDNKAEQKKYAKTFIADYKSYVMDIEAAGVAEIPTAKLSMEEELYVEYAYTSGNEKRNGRMTLELTDKNRFTGKWKTDADNGNSYSGTLYFKFNENGEANGHYKFDGTDYKITILKK